MKKNRLPFSQPKSTAKVELVSRVGNISGEKERQIMLLPCLGRNMGEENEGIRWKREKLPQECFSHT